MINPVNSREVILEILTDVFENNKYSHIVLRETLNKFQQLDKTNRSFITKVSEGTIENMLKIDYIINQFSKVKVNKMKPLIRNLIRMSVYQILEMDSVPDSAICNEAVKIAGKRGFVNLKGFVNGVLRNIARNINSIEYPKTLVDSYVIKYSMPEWIINLWLKDYGQDIMDKILEGNKKIRKLVVRCNLSKATIEEIIKSLTNQGVTVEQSPLIKEALLLSNYDYLDKLQAHQDGLIQVQDISSMLVAKIANSKKDDYIIDVCAAPGGKSLHLADLLNGSGKVEARDLSKYKTDLIRDNLSRIKFTNVEVIESDATQLDETVIGKADIIIADLPCSGLGVISKKTDLKYKVKSESIDSLVLLQREILTTIQTYVKPNGVLIYSTCTLNKKENEDNMLWFLEKFSYQLESIDEYIPEVLKSDTSKKGYLQLYPGENQTDGFFMARFRRNKDGKN